MQFVFIVCQVEGYLEILKLSFRPLTFTSYKAFFKKTTKAGLELVSCLIFCMTFGEKYLCCGEYFYFSCGDISRYFGDISISLTKVFLFLLRGSYILCCLLMFVKNCLCFEFLVLKCIFL